MKDERERYCRVGRKGTVLQSGAERERYCRVGQKGNGTAEWGRKPESYLLIYIIQKLTKYDLADQIMENFMVGWRATCRYGMYGEEEKPIQGCSMNI